jgi:hypothetical protein
MSPVPSADARPEACVDRASNLFCLSRGAGLPRRWGLNFISDDTPGLILSGRSDKLKIASSIAPAIQKIVECRGLASVHVHHSSLLTNLRAGESPHRPNLHACHQMACGPNNTRRIRRICCLVSDMGASSGLNRTELELRLKPHGWRKICDLPEDTSVEFGR